MAEEEYDPEWKQVVFPEPKSIIELHSTFNYWLYLDKNDIDALDCVLAAALDRDIPGDPLWIYLIAPSGGIKTEFVRALKEYPRIYTLDTLTPATFISGKTERDKDTGEIAPIAGILEHINKKVLVIKDFTVILSSSDLARTEIYGQLRAIHDGYFEKAFGTMDTPIRVESKIGLIAAVTPAIDRYTKAHNILGERFLKVRLHPDAEETTKKAFQNLGREERMRKDLSTAVGYYLQLLATYRLYPQLKRPQMNLLIKLARYVALMRTRVMGRYAHGILVEPYLTEPEIPTRVVKQLKKLAMGLAMVRQHGEITEEDIDTIKRVTKDCSIPVRQKIVEGLATFLDKKGALAFQLQHTTKLPLNTVKNELIKMVILGIVDENFPLKEEENNNPKDNVPFYTFTPKFGDLYGVLK